MLLGVDSLSSYIEYLAGKLFLVVIVLADAVFVPFCYESVLQYDAYGFYLFQVVIDLLNPAGQNLRIREDLQVLFHLFSIIPIN